MLNTMFEKTFQMDLNSLTNHLTEDILFHNRKMLFFKKRKKIVLHIHKRIINSLSGTSKKRAEMSNQRIYHEHLTLKFT